MTRIVLRIVFSIIVLGAFPAFAQTPTSLTPPAASPSLFFSGAELERIEKENHKTSPQISVSTRDVIALGAVLYYGPENWAVWLQNERWTPATKRPDMHIVDVTPDRVMLTFTPQEGGSPRKIVLKPHQAYHLSSRQITENE